MENLYRFLTLVCLLSLQSVAAQTGTLDEEGLSAENCAGCHTQAKHLQQLANMDQCKSCHSNMDHPGRLHKVAQALKAAQSSDSSSSGSSSPGVSGSKKSKPPLPPVKPPLGEPLAATAGMRFPMYYQGSRIGEKPNEMVLVPAGSFTMGTNDRLPDEGPEHKVHLAAFYIDIYEVTNLQYKQFNNALNRRSPRHFRNRTFPEGKADHPVTYVNWEDADAYCRWAGKRLPTDQEWEKAARGTDGRMFPWGNVFDVKKANTPIRWQQIRGFGDTTPVGAFDQGQSAYGLYDMTGNVWEWTASWYRAYPGNTVASESYGRRYKTLKGGSWFDCSFYKCGISAPVFNRAFFAVHTKNDSFGFRCAKDAGLDKVQKNK